MDRYEEMYYKLFNKVTDVIEELMRVQQETEDILLSYSTEKPDNILHIRREDDGGEKKPPEQ